MPSAKRILLVDSNEVPRRMLAQQLAREGSYAVIEAGSAAQASAAGVYDLAILDTATARSLDFSGPILFLTDGEETGLGGDQLVKPFRLSALLAMLAARLGHQGAGDDEGFAIGPYIFRPGAKLLTDGKGRKIRLTEKETNILRFLHGAADTVPRETLLHEVWGYSPAATTHTLETHIYRLRRKIEENPGQARIVVTEGGGYRLG